MAKKDRGTSESRSRNERSESLLSKLGFGGSDKSEPEKPMKATDMLEKDHRKVEALFSQYDEQEGSAAKKKQIVDEITRELDVHAQLEEKIFYQSVRNAKDQEPKKIVRESFEEHKIVKTLLAELARMSPSDGQYDAKVTVLKESVQHHVKEEEGELFPAAEKEFSDEHLRRLGEEMTDLKEELQEASERSPRRRARKTSTRPGRSRQRPAEA